MDNNNYWNWYNKSQYHTHLGCLEVEVIVMMAHSFNNIKESSQNQALFKEQRTQVTSWNPSLRGGYSPLNCVYSG